MPRMHSRSMIALDASPISLFGDAHAVPSSRSVDF